MRLQIKHIQLRIDWLMLLFPIIAATLGEGRQTLLLMLSLFLHESAHLLAARALHVRISHLRLTPFGAMVRIENPYTLSTIQLIAISIAGPAANLLIMLISAAMCHWQLLAPSYGADLLQINLILMLFNLIPALPLDGGRILYALLSTVLPRQRAVNIGILIGKILAMALLLISAAGIALYNHLNLSPIFAALFLLASAQDERSALTDSRIRSLINCMHPLNEPLPVSIMAISDQMSAETALKSANPDRITLFAVYENERFTHFIDDRAILRQILNKDKNSTL